MILFFSISVGVSDPSDTLIVVLSERGEGKRQLPWKRGKIGGNEKRDPWEPKESIR